MEKSVNRVLQVWKSWEEKQTELEKTVGNGKEHDKVIRRLKLEHFLKCRNLLSGNLRKDEQPFLPLINSAVSKLEMEVHPNLLLRLLFQIKNFLVDKPAQLKAHELQRQENLRNLKSDLLKAGFGDFAGGLERYLDPMRQQYEVLLSSQLDQNRSLKINLHFEKDTEDRFHLAIADAAVRHQNKDIPDRFFAFKINDWPGVNVQQIKNLLEGRAIKQDFTDVAGRPTSHWLELPGTGEEVKRYNQNYGYDLKGILEQEQFGPLVFANGKDSLIQQLQSGHQVAVRWSHAGSYETVSIRADPSSGTIQLVDPQQKAISPEALNKKLEGQKEKREAVIKQITRAPKISQGKRKSRIMAK